MELKVGIVQLDAQADGLVRQLADIGDPVASDRVLDFVAEQRIAFGRGELPGNSLFNLFAPIPPMPRGDKRRAAVAWALTRRMSVPQR